jgi:hypothetical protein
VKVHGEDKLSGIAHCLKLRHVALCNALDFEEGGFLVKDVNVVRHDVSDGQIVGADRVRFEQVQRLPGIGIRLVQRMDIQAFLGGHRQVEESLVGARSGRVVVRECLRDFGKTIGAAPLDLVGDFEVQH